MDTLIRGGIVVTCDAGSRVFAGDVLVQGRTIEAIVQRGARTRENAPPRLPRPARVLDASGCAVIPGFVQAHVHLCQALFRGMADDLPLLEWLERHIWPLEAAHDEASLTASSDLGLAEMLRAGTTTILDMGTVRHHDAVMAACLASGIRAVSGKTMMDQGDRLPSALRESTRASLRESERLAAEWHGKGEGRLQYAVSPRFILSCSEELVRQAAALAADRGVVIHTHAAEHPSERAAVRARLGDDDVALLRRWGLTGPHAVLAHGVQLTDEEARELALEGTSVVHCPSANLKLGSGIARIAELDRAGVGLALGADGAPCNNNMDPWVELRHAALLAKVRSGTTALPAQRALRLATIDGARALGLGEVTGSIEVGKRADLAVVRVDDVHAEPGGDVVSKLVYACGARDVVDVMVDGETLVRRGEHTRFDAARVAARARERANEVAGRARV